MATSAARVSELWLLDYTRVLEYMTRFYTLAPWPLVDSGSFILRHPTPSWIPPAKLKNEVLAKRYNYTLPRIISKSFNTRQQRELIIYIV